MNRIPSWMVPVVIVLVLVIIGVVYFIQSCWSPILLGFPLGDDNRWTYAITYTASGAGKTFTIDGGLQEIRLRQSTLGQRLGNNDPRPLWILALNAALAPIVDVGLIADSAGIRFADNTAADSNLVLPGTVRRGASWRVEYMGEQFQLHMVRQETIRVPAGSFRTARIDFRGNRGTAGRAWMEPMLGIVRMSYRYQGSGPRQQVDLNLVRATLHREGQVKSIGPSGTPAGS